MKSDKNNPAAYSGIRAALRAEYPNLTAEELEESVLALVRYLELVQRIYKRIRQSPEEYARFKRLTAKVDDSNMSDIV